MTAAISLDRIAKRYGATIALADASLAIEVSSVHALLGENGAGKSTLVKILSGVVRPDAGSMAFFGRDVRLANRDDSSRHGLEAAFQEVPLVPDLTVGQNLLLPDEPRRFLIFRNSREARNRVAQILSDLNLEGVDPDEDVRELNLSVRQKIEIARAISRNPKILLLDEPTAALSARDVQWLGDRIRLLQAHGTTVVLVTHRLQEVREFCQSLSVLRNGAHVGSHRVRDVSDAEVFSLIMGRTVEAAFPRRPTEPVIASRPILEVDHFAAARLADVSLVLRPGEIVGLAALQGMGQLELFNGLFGVEPLTDGTLRIDGEALKLCSPRDAIKAGIGLVPEDRKTEGLALTMTGRENASLATLARFTHFGWVDQRSEASVVDEIFAKLKIPPRAQHKAAGSFSGGTQQKIVLAKWLLTGCKILLAFDPTRGVDVGTKHEIYILLRQFADAGGAVFFHSTEVPELVGLADRVLVMYRGRIAAELREGALTEDAIGLHMLGTTARSGGSASTRLA
jgi:ribose transport system ATP-binding protein